MLERQTVVVVVTATATQSPTATAFTPPPPQATHAVIQTAEPIRSLIETREYVVQPGDTLSGIALRFGVTVDLLQAVNDLENPNLLRVGQTLILPQLPDILTEGVKLIPDSRLVRAPGSNQFDIATFIDQQPGYIRVAADEVTGSILNAAQIVERVALEFSVDPRLLLSLLEYRSEWLSRAEVDEQAQIYPLRAGPSPLGFDRNGLYRQLTWAADQLNRGYYNWKYGDLRTITLNPEGIRLTIEPGLNPGTVGLQYMLAQFNRYDVWLGDISQSGFIETYQQYFGDPFDGAIEPLVPADLIQPELTLPFPEDQTWFFTGGPHGGWGSGSAWAAVDFAPPDDPAEVNSACYISRYTATAAAAGVIARTADGVVILDLDGDGDESTGWSLLYLHIATDGRAVSGTQVNVGDPIGYPSCDGGFSTGTHIHIARRYNGEWLPADCSSCTGISVPPFVMGQWRVIGLIGQEYQGYLTNGNERRTADQGRLSPDNRVTW